MRALCAVLPLVASVVAQHIFYQIPQVEADVQRMRDEFSDYVNYAGPPQKHGLPAAAKPTRVNTAQATSTACSYWLDDVLHQGVAAFNLNTSYNVYRNVMDYGAKGDGVTDDTAAINKAISDGGRFGPQAGVTSTITPAVVYFPPGTYLLSTSIIDYYNTQLIGNPNCLPTLTATATFSGFGLIDGDKDNGFGSTNIFWRQVRNFIIDLTPIPGNAAATGIHWPTAQATSLQNIIFKMSENPGPTNGHQGVYIDSGSGGFVNDLIFYGGLYGLNAGNQQFTMRNLTFHNTVTAISQIWDWGWTYKNINIYNCSVGVNMTQVNSASQASAAVIVMDSFIQDTPIGIATSHTATSQPPAAGALIVENVIINNVAQAVTQGNGFTTALAGTSGQTTIKAWGQGHFYTPTGPQAKMGVITPNTRPAALGGGPNGGYYERSKPQYEGLPKSMFVIARNNGAVGDGVTDDTAAVQLTINKAVAQGKVVFFNAGTYKVTSTIYVPAGSKMVGESYSVIMSSGNFFANINAPQPVVQIGKRGESGSVEWSDMIMSTQGPQAGAVLIQWNLASPSTSPSGMWDVHARIGGFLGSDLQGNTCPTTSTTVITSSNLPTQCIAAYLTMQITTSATGLYLENVWLWTADHDVDANYGGNQITLFTGRGLYIASIDGILWLYGTAVEHHSKYQYQLAGTKNIVLGQIQTETAYYQPNPNAIIPFPTNTTINDPTFSTATFAPDPTVPNANGWGLRILNSEDILIYGAGHYSFFDNYNVTCSNEGNGEICQSRIVDVQNSTGISIYDLHTVGAHEMLSTGLMGPDVAIYSDNLAGFIDEIARYKSN